METEETSEETLMISFTAIMVIALILGLLIGRFRLRVYAILPFACAALMITFIIGAVTVVDIGIAHIGAVAKLLGIEYVGALIVFEFGFLLGAALLYSPPYSLRNIRTWLHM